MVDVRENEITEIYGENVFNSRTMRNYLSEKAFASLTRTISEGSALEAGIADEVAEAMKTWAIEKGATHFTHWFQPLTGTTAEKHDSFVTPDGDGGAVLRFSGKELIQGEPDASSFPSGGLRATFEARGYTAWDPTSPAFIKEGPNGCTLCIPTIFCGYHGEALDKKTPLLRSMQALNTQLCRLGQFFGINCPGKRAWPTLGPEQEYFLIDKDYYNARLDLVQTGRTLFGRKPAKHQQMEDHYFGSIKTRVMAFMVDLDRELWRLGVPSRTRHNEVCPAQFEIAPMYENLNLAVDHNMIVMETLRSVAEQHDFVCLLHEKPYAGVNGSGKHNNWSVCGPDGKNWLTPGENPHENAKFLTMIVALMKAVDTHADLLRAAVATAGNDHRLGANEAPPAIISIFLGEQLSDVIDQLEKGGASSSKSGGEIQVGVTSLPTLPRDATDRNRTSPFAFTGNKFEFRMVGSSQSLSGPNFVLNTIVAETLSEIADHLEGAKDVNGKVQALLQKYAKEHEAILYNGDNYTEAWAKEAARRGLPNIRNCVDSINTMMDEENVKVLIKHGTLPQGEITARHEILLENYVKTINIEAKTMLCMAGREIVPAVMGYASDLAGGIGAVKAAGVNPDAQVKLLKTVNGAAAGLSEAMEALKDAMAKAASVGHAPEKAAAYRDLVVPAMVALRKQSDDIEPFIGADRWPLPTYGEMLFSR